MRLGVLRSKFSRTTAMCLGQAGLSSSPESLSVPWKIPHPPDILFPVLRQVSEPSPPGWAV